MNSEIYTAGQIAGFISEKENLPFPEQTITTLLTDSRKVTNAAQAIFFALKGQKDAHVFIDALYNEGVRCFVYYNEHFDISEYPEANFIIVNNPLKALQKLARLHREKFDIPVLAITGSNGKTVVKEWLYQLMSYKYRILRSPKSYNSQIGVPLSVWKLGKQYNYAIFEAGISKSNEMEKLETIIQPKIGVLTNIGSAHDEGFESTEQKIVEKFKLFKNVTLLICNSTFKKYATVPVFTWSLVDEADLSIKNMVSTTNSTKVAALYNGYEVSLQIPFIDKASIENAIICWATLLALGFKQEDIEDKIERLQHIRMRLELKSGINQTSIIDDSYNSDFSSLEIALDFLNQQNQHQQKTLILSDIFQSGLEADKLYERVALLIKAKNINRFIGIGEELSAHKVYFDGNSQFFKNTQDFLNFYKEKDFANETILIKGARSFGFEKISKALSQKVHETILEINLNAMEQNLNYYRSKLAPGVKIMTMVKAFGYGSGSFEVANLLQFNRVDYLAVAYADEGVALRQAGITLPIMVMSPETSSIEAIVKHNLEPEIFSFSSLELFTKYLRAHKIANYNIHLKLETGMNRLGFNSEELPQLLNYLEENPEIHIQSVFSHLVGSESEEHDDFTRKQIGVFTDFCEKLEKNIGYQFIKHISNTSGISRWPNAQFDMVRLGIGLYGVDNLSKDDENLTLVATLKTTVSQIKHHKKGDTIGYGRHGVMPYDGETATVKIGYADGYIRALGKGVGSMFIKNQEVFTIGNICMDMCMLDVTGKGVKEGDEVIVFDSQKTLFNLADKLNTIPYEVLTNISQRVKRIYYYE